MYEDREQYGIRRSFSSEYDLTQEDVATIQALPPLKRFARAKQEVTAVFQQFSATLAETATFLLRPLAWKEQQPGQPVIVHEDLLTAERELVDSTAEKVENIRQAVTRNSMKVVFIGRTSNGKSTTINAMLHAKILPNGIGHTTNCFCSLQGTNADKPYLNEPGSGEHKDIDDVKNWASAFSLKQQLPPESVVELFWPRQKCHLLGDDVVIMDSPGLDISKDFDRWIDQHCMDADVFVLVANSESTLDQTERNFFHQVKAKLSKPNVFVQYNKWDCMDDEENENPIELVKKQHLDNAKKFLCNSPDGPEGSIKGLGLIDPEQINSRCFFVSAREVLSHRSKDPSKRKEMSRAKKDRYRCGRLRCGCQVFSFVC